MTGRSGRSHNCSQHLKGAFLPLLLQRPGGVSVSTHCPQGSTLISSLPSSRALQSASPSSLRMQDLFQGLGQSIEMQLKSWQNKTRPKWYVAELMCQFLQRVDLQISYSSVQFSSVTQSCTTLCDPMDCRTPALPIYHQFSECTQIHVH